ncbi:MAG: molybdopterin-dependent oxidoreductase [Bacteroidales bacterium]
MAEFITACPRNCYSTCTFRVEVEDNIIRRILPYPGNRATPGGPCIKGQSYIERSSTPKRILHPLLRNKEGGFDTISMDEAIAILAKRIPEIKEKYGSHSILWYRGSGKSSLINESCSSFWKALGGVTTTYGNLCWPAGLEAVRLTMGSVKCNVPWDIENARTVVIWGKNPAETNIHEMAFVDKAREKGAKIIVIDSRRTPTADKSSLFVRPAIATDGALALAMAHVIVNEGLADRRFIESNVNGYDEFVKNSLMSPSEASSICGINEEDIRLLALEIASGGPVTFIPGYGLQRYPNGGQTIRAILSLAVITGNIGRSGSGFNYANLQSYVFDRVKEPVSYYPDPKEDLPFRRTISMAKLGEDILKTADPPIKMIWVERGNPVLQSPDSNSVLKAFANAEFTVVSEQFLTDTAKQADLVLPAIDIFEQPDITGSYWSPYVQYRPAVLKPEGETMPETELYYRLAKKIGLSISEEQLPAPGNENAEKWLSSRIKGYTWLSLEDLKNGPVLAPGLEEIAWENMKFDTASGKIELCNPEFSARWGVAAFPCYSPLKTDKDSSYPLTFISPNASSRIHSQFGNLDIIRQNSNEAAAGISPADAMERGIETNDYVRLFNEKGSVVTKALVTSRVPRGIVVLHNGIWLDEGGGGNFLTAPLETDMGYGSAFHGASINIEKAG